MVWEVWGDPSGETHLDHACKTSVPMQRGARFVFCDMLPMQRGTRFLKTNHQYALEFSYISEPRTQYTLEFSVFYFWTLGRFMNLRIRPYDVLSRCSDVIGVHVFLQALIVLHFRV